MVTTQEKIEVREILDQRGSRYGSFQDNARISQELSRLIAREHVQRITRGQLPLQYHQLEALEMICHKIARIISGDADYEDNWIDIAGYAELGRNPR